MAKLLFDAVGERLYEIGVKYGVLFKLLAGVYQTGVPWNGLTAISENPTGAEPTALYADDTKYLNIMSAEEFGAAIEAYTYPEEFLECDGSKEMVNGVVVGQQERKSFGLAYRTAIGNDVDGTEHGYKIHLIYGAMAAPSEKAFNTINETPEAITFSWDITTTPVAVTGGKPTASLVIDSTKVDSVKLGLLEDIIYGTANSDARLPLPDEVIALFTEAAPSAVALDTIAPDTGDIDVAIASNIVMTFNNAIQSEAIVVAKDDGTIVAGVKTWDATSKILTFNPIGNLDNSATYIVTVVGVVDIYAQALAVETSTFTTVDP